MADLIVDLQKKFHLATELRDNIDLFCQGSTYAIFLKKLWPVFQKILEGPPAFMSASLEHVRPIEYSCSSCGMLTFVDRNFATAYSKSSTDCP